MLRRLLLFLLLQPVFLLGTIRPARPRARHDRRAFIARAVGALGSLALRSADADDLPAGEAAATLPSGPEDKTIAEIPASGIVFKDIVKVDRVNDPKVEGVQLYVSDFQRPITERLQSDFFSDPAQAAVTCVKTGPIKLHGVDESEAGEEVFSQARSLLFKSVKVRRVYDKEVGAIVYVSYSTRLDKSQDEQRTRFRSSICVVKVD